jgi:hypothetical protein
MAKDEDAKYILATVIKLMYLMSLDIFFIFNIMQEFIKFVG